jgi:hypothetical protein
MENLAHSASLHSKDNIAPSNSGIKHLVSLLSGGPDSLAILLRRMAEVIEQELRSAASAWLRDNTGQLRLVGQDVWWAFVHIVVGMVIGP